MHNGLTDVLFSIYMAYSTYHTVDRCAPQKQATTMAGGGGVRLLHNRCDFPGDVTPEMRSGTINGVQFAGI